MTAGELLLKRSVINRLPLHEQQMAKALSLVYLFSGMVHCVFCFVFYHLGVRELFIYNIVAPVIYLVCYWMNRRAHITFPALLGVAEASAHAFLSIVYIGWISNFHIYTLLTIILVFFIYNISIIYKIFVGLVVAFLYTFFYYYSFKYAPEYQLTEHIIKIFGGLNLITASLVLGMYSFAYTTLIKRNIDKLEQAEQYQKKLNEQKIKFFSVFSHDLKNPVATLQSFIELLISRYDKIDEKKKRTFINYIHESVSEVDKLINGLLDWSRTQLNSVEINPKVLDVNNVLIQLHSLYTAEAKKKGVLLKLSMESSLQVFSDEQMLNAILRNIISNAIKFTGHSGSVMIDAVKENEKVKISVIDTGVGIPKEDLEDIFEISEKQIRPGTNNERGTGLGLLVANEFTHKNGGVIKVESEVGVGSTFTIVLPLS